MSNWKWISGMADIDGNRVIYADHEGVVWTFYERKHICVCYEYNLKNAKELTKRLKTPNLNDLATFLIFKQYGWSL